MGHVPRLCRRASSQIASQDRSHNLTFAGVWDLPFGRNRTFLNHLGGVSRAILGTWTFNTTLMYQSGVPLASWSGWARVCGDPLAGARTETRWFE
jgi:hypothetical protein